VRSTSLFPCGSSQRAFGRQRSNSFLKQRSGRAAASTERPRIAVLKNPNLGQLSWDYAGTVEQKDTGGKFYQGHHFLDRARRCFSRKRRTFATLPQSLITHQRRL